MKKYKETPEWWFLLVLGIAMALGMIGVGVYPSHTTPAVVIFGIIMAAICVVPVGLIASVTGIQVTMNGKTRSHPIRVGADSCSARRVHWWCYRQGQRRRDDGEPQLLYAKGRVTDLCSISRCTAT